MIPQIVLSFCSLVALAVIQVSLFAVLPGPLRLIQPVFIVGVLLYHLIRPQIGAVWLILGGVVLSVLGDRPGTILVAYAASAILGIFLARSVFTNRSVYAMMGLGAVMFLPLAIVDGIVAGTEAVRGIAPISFGRFFAIEAVALVVLVLSLLLTYDLGRRLLRRIQRLVFLRLP